MSTFRRFDDTIRRFGPPRNRFAWDLEFHTKFWFGLCVSGPLCPISQIRKCNRNAVSKPFMSSGKIVLRRRLLKMLEARRRSAGCPSPPPPPRRNAHPVPCKRDAERNASGGYWKHQTRSPVFDSTNLPHALQPRYRTLASRALASLQRCIRKHSCCRPATVRVRPNKSAACRCCLY